MVDRKAIKRVLNKAGFKHVSGWVMSKDTARIERMIDDAKPKVDRVKAELKMKAARGSNEKQKRKEIK